MSGGRHSGKATITRDDVHRLREDGWSPDRHIREPPEWAPEELHELEDDTARIPIQGIIEREGAHLSWGWAGSPPEQRVSLQVDKPISDGAFLAVWLGMFAVAAMSWVGLVLLVLRLVLH
jgi:hypothetical protein